MTHPAAMQATHECTHNLVIIINLPDLSDTLHACNMGEQPLRNTISTIVLQRAILCIARVSHVIKLKLVNVNTVSMYDHVHACSQKARLLSVLLRSKGCQHGHMSDNLMADSLRLVRLEVLAAF